MRITQSDNNDNAITLLLLEQVGIVISYIHRSVTKRGIVSVLAIFILIRQLIFVLDVEEYDDSFSQHFDPLQRLPSPRVGAYYYAWYEELQWKTWKTKFIPELGLYQSQDDVVLRAHSNWARQANIEFFVMSWSDQKNHDNVIRYLNHVDTIPIAIHIETLILYSDSRLNRTAQSDGLVFFNEPCKNIYTGDEYTFRWALLYYMFKVMDEIVLPYRDKYIFVGNRPVFIIYLAREFVDYSKGMDRLRKEFFLRYGVQPYLIADVVGFVKDERVKFNTRQYGIHAWDSITAYNRFEGRSTESLDEYMKRLENEYDTYSIFVHGNHGKMPVVPYVQPGYDDSLIRGDDHGPDGIRPTYDRNYGKTYHKFWDLAQRLLEKNPCNGIDPRELFIFVCTFNEWHESTSIEPSTEWGNKMLQITRERSTTMKPSCDPKAHRVQTLGIFKSLSSMLLSETLSIP